MTDIGMCGLSRRRFISIVAGCAGAAATPSAIAGESSFRWHGRALGAEAEIVIYAKHADEARRLVEAGVDEIERLERQFSLYRDDSVLVLLNAAGRIETPSHDLLKLLDRSRRISDLTNGAFDVSIQPLWTLYAEHFRKPDADPNGPEPDSIERALRAVDYRAIEVSSDAVILRKPGMALSFNGVAQGYITDSVARLFRAAGVRDVLVNLGEFQALGTNRDVGRPWRIGINVGSSLSGEKDYIEMTDRALATSAPTGMAFDQSARHHHIFNPYTGRSTTNVRSVTVVAPTATAADALSTALTVTDREHREAIVAKYKGITAWITNNRGVVEILKS